VGGALNASSKNLTWNWAGRVKNQLERMPTLGIECPYSPRFPEHVSQSGRH